MSRHSIATTLTYLLLAFSWSYVQGSLVEDTSNSPNPCAVKAWVRAPDLVPGQLIAGDVKIKLSDECPGVSSYSLGLRFSERSWVKTKAKEVNLTEPLPSFNVSSNHTANGVYSPGMWFNLLSYEGDLEEWGKHHKDLMNPALWLTREEERIGFEIRHTLLEGNGLSYNLVQSFAILVPNTNYPPVFDTLSNFMHNHDSTDAADTEHIYAYFVEVKFVNGTVREIPAGYTSFRSSYEPPSSTLETIHVVVTPSPDNIVNERASAKNSATHDSPSQDEFTLEVTFPQGRNVSQGSEIIVSIKSHQVGPGVMRPLKIDSFIQARRNCEWSASYATDDKTAEKLRASCTRYVNSQILPSDAGSFNRPDYQFETHRFSQRGEIQSGTTFSTESIDMAFNISKNCFPTFTMHYQTVESLFQMSLFVRNTSVDDEYDWTPKEMTTKKLVAEIPITIYPQLGDPTLKIPEGVHYLSVDARSPIFVDPFSVEQLRQKTVQDRDLLAPIVQARFNNFSGEDIIKHRYYAYSLFMDPHIDGQYYVGDTWLRKVLAKEGEEKYDHTTDTALRLQL